jgi:hypothetical protein
MAVCYFSQKNDHCAPNFGTWRIQVLGEQDQPQNGYLIVFIAF